MNKLGIKLSLKTIILLALLIIQSNNLISGLAKSQILNREGYALHKQREFEKAIIKFREAVAEDPSNAKAHYNLACAIAILFGNGECDDRYTYGEIIGHLREAVRLEPFRKEKMQFDPDLASIHKTIAYLEMFLSTTKSEDVRKILTTIKWYVPSGGAVPICLIDFHVNGSVFLNFFEEAATGEYNVNGSDIIIRFKAPFRGQNIIKGQLKDGELIFNNFLAPALSLHPSSCDA